MTWCGIALVAFVTLSVGFIVLFGDREDRPAGLFRGLPLTLVSGVLAVSAALGARSVQRTLARSEAG